MLVALLTAVNMSSSQSLTGQEVLEKSIRYHDPEGLWQKAHIILDLKETRPDRNDRNSHAEIDNSRSYFNLVRNDNGHSICHIFENGECRQLLDFNKNFSKEEKEKFKLNCERTTLLRNYYTYLWGMPMKLTDEGTIIDPQIKRVEFNGDNSIAVKVTYDPEVGSDTWYFYFNPKSYALVGYRFYHDESKNDGEFIVLKDELKAGSLKFPKSRTWYVNTDNKLLGEDILENVMFKNN